MRDLQIRAKKMGFQDMELWQTLSWIREFCPLIIHLNLDKVGRFFLSDDHYRNQFETGASGGFLGRDTRIKWERDLFGTQ